MKKRFKITAFISAILLFSSLAWGALYYYSGTMESTFEMTQSYVIAVPNDNLTSLTFTLALPEEYTLPNNSQSITGLNISYSGDPSVEDYTDVYGSHFKEIIWTNPARGEINVTLNYTVSSFSDWDVPMPDDVFPFDSSGLPYTITQYLQPTEMVQSDDPAFTDLADNLTGSLTTQREALKAIIGWIMDNIDYQGSPSSVDALTTYNLKTGNCSSYAHIALAVVRAAGIPARLVHGYALSKRYELLTAGDPLYPNWGQGTHAWIEVYYPSLGWVPYDPQRDLHHIDTHRVIWGRGTDTQGIISDTSWTYDSIPAGFPQSYWRVYVTWIDDSIDLSFIKSTDEIDAISYSSAEPSIQDYTITATGEIGGSILPSGSVGVSEGTSRTFTITPRTGYLIQDVSVDGESQGAVSSYTFDNISADHTIEVEFEAQPVVSTSSGSGSSCFIDTVINRW